MISPLDVARRLHAEGYAPIAVPFGSKNPNRKGWEGERWDADELPLHFNGRRQNIGALCGEPSGGRVDADLDCDEAVVVAPLLLPRTDRIGGRASRPDSHYWYIADEPPAKAATQYRDPVRMARGERDQAMLVELRSTGGQTVVYGRHPEGDAYAWFRDGEPAGVKASTLLRRVACVAVASLMARYWPAVGARHTGALAWSGFLLNGGVPPNTVTAIIHAAAVAANDEEADDRRTAARTTAVRIDADEPVTGGPTLADLLGGHGSLILNAVKKWLFPRVTVGDADDEEELDDPTGGEAPKSGSRQQRRAQERAQAKAERRSLPQVVETFSRWLYLPDPDYVIAVLGALAANVLPGDPTWLMVVGPSSGGKTEPIIACRDVADTRLVSALSNESALLSGTSKRERQADATGGLLREIGGFGVLLLKDFTSILSMPRDPRAQLLAALREVYDGGYVRRIGSDGGRTLAWEGKCGMIAGCTEAIDTAHAVMSAMGERFLLYRLPAIDGELQAQRALANAGAEGSMRDELAAAVAGLFAGIEIPDTLPAMAAEARARLVALGTLAARARSGVERDGRTREIELVYSSEAPARLTAMLGRLYTGLRVIGTDAPTAWRIVAKSALDCMPKNRRAVFDALAAAADWRQTDQLALAVRLPTTSVRRSVEELTAHGVAERQKRVKNADAWRLTAWTMDLLDRACFPEMSQETRRERTSQGGDDDPSTYTNTAYNNFSGKQAEEEDGGEETSRASACWRCRTPVVDDADEPCDRCGWLICPTCGVCDRECGRSVEATACEACGAPKGEGRLAPLCLNCAAAGPSVEG